MTNCLFKLSNYIFAGSQRSTSGGGAGVYVWNDIAVQVLPVVVLAGSCVHLVRLDIDVSAPSVVLTVVYRQPSSGVVEFLNDLELHISTTQASNHIIAGDININTLDPSNEDYSILLATYCFYNKSSFQPIVLNPLTDEHA